MRERSGQKKERDISNIKQQEEGEIRVREKGKGREGKEKQAIGGKMSKTEEKNEGGEKKVERNGKKANAN